MFVFKLFCVKQTLFQQAMLSTYRNQDKTRNYEIQFIHNSKVQTFVFNI